MGNISSILSTLRIIKMLYFLIHVFEIRKKTPKPYLRVKCVLSIFSCNSSIDPDPCVF